MLHRLFLSFLVGMYLLVALPTTALSADTSKTPEAVDARAQTVLRQAFGDRLGSGSALDLTPAPAPGLNGCVQRTIQCGQSVNAILDVLDCATDPPDVLFFDIWSFNGQAGQDVTINYASSQFDTFMILVDPNLNSFEVDDDGGSGLSSRIQTTLNQSGEWTILASSFLPGATGAYQLALDCVVPPPVGDCVEGPQTLCLADDRFRVEVDWATNQGTSGQGQAVELTPDTGYFWFFEQSNVEMVIKVLDTCSFANRFWVFAGGLTNVEVDITVTDTLRNQTRFYRNPLGTPFQPIQDTNAFATCP